MDVARTFSDISVLFKFLIRLHDRGSHPSQRIGASRSFRENNELKEKKKKKKLTVECSWCYDYYYYYYRNNDVTLYDKNDNIINIHYTLEFVACVPHAS